MIRASKNSRSPKHRNDSHSIFRSLREQRVKALRDPELEPLSGQAASSQLAEGLMTTPYLRAELCNGLLPFALDIWNKRKLMKFA